MPQSILGQLDLTLDDVLALPGRERTRLLNFLLRWDHVDALHACLDTLIPHNPTLVSLLDLRARAYLAQERYADRAIGRLDPVREPKAARQRVHRLSELAHAGALRR